MSDNNGIGVTPDQVSHNTLGVTPNERAGDNCVMTQDLPTSMTRDLPTSMTRDLPTSAQTKEEQLIMPASQLMNANLATINFTHVPKEEVVALLLGMTHLNKKYEERIHGLTLAYNVQQHTIETCQNTIQFLESELRICKYHVRCVQNELARVETFTKRRRPILFYHVRCGDPRRSCFYLLNELTLVQRNVLSFVNERDSCSPAVMFKSFMLGVCPNLYYITQHHPCITPQEMMDVLIQDPQAEASTPLHQLIQSFVPEIYGLLRSDVSRAIGNVCVGLRPGTVVFMTFVERFDAEKFHVESHGGV